MSKDLKLFDALGTNLRTGLTSDGTAYVVTADLAQSVNVPRVNDLTRNMPTGDGYYKGEEVIPVNDKGDRRKVSVLYKRGVFHVLMVSRKPEAMAFKDRLFDFLEEYEREGFVVKPDITPEQTVKLIHETDYLSVVDALKRAVDVDDLDVLSDDAFINMRDGFFKIVVGTTDKHYRDVNMIPFRDRTRSYFSEEEADVLQGLSMQLLGKLRARYPRGGYTVAQFSEVFYDTIKSNWDLRKKIEY